MAEERPADDELSFWTPEEEKISSASSWVFDSMSDGKHGMMPPEEPLIITTFQ